ncbi:unnamed protein product, partial [Allacma fusca]
YNYRFGGPRALTAPYRVHFDKFIYSVFGIFDALLVTWVEPYKIPVSHPQL